MPDHPTRRAPRTTPPPGIAAAGALAHESRRRIADALGENPAGLSVTAIADHVGLHPNAVRRHLGRLAEAGVVAAEREEPRGRGRPGMRYRLVDVDAPRIAAHQELVRLLVGYLVRTGASAEDVEAFGREQGGFFADGRGSGAVMETFARLGFAPHQTDSAPDAASGRLTLRLGHCPFREAVLAPGGDIVCRLHRGLADGVAAAAVEGGRLTEFVPADPATAGCLVGFEGMAGTAARPA